MLVPLDLRERTIPLRSRKLQTGGFWRCETVLSPVTLSSPGFDLWAMLTTGAPLAQILLDRIGLDGRDRLRDVLGRLVERRFGSGPIRVTNAATVGHGVVR